MVSARFGLHITAVVAETAFALHASHLRHRSDCGKESNESDEVDPNGSCGAAIHEDERGGAELSLPSRHQDHRETEDGEKAKIALCTGQYTTGWNRCNSYCPRLTRVSCCCMVSCCYGLEYYL